MTKVDPSERKLKYAPRRSRYEIVDPGRFEKDVLQLIEDALLLATKSRRSDFLKAYLAVTMKLQEVLEVYEEEVEPLLSNREEEEGEYEDVHTARVLKGTLDGHTVKDALNGRKAQ